MSEDVISLLRVHKKKIERLNNLRTELDVVMHEYGSVNGGGMGVKGSQPNGNAGIERCVERRVSLETQIAETEQETEHEWCHIETFFDNLTAVECLLLNLRYHHAMLWNDVGRVIYRNKTDFDDNLDRYMARVYTAHQRALNTLQHPPWQQII